MEYQSNLYDAQAGDINLLLAILQLWLWSWHPVFSGAGLTGMPVRYGDFLDLWDSRVFGCFLRSHVSAGKVSRQVFQSLGRSFP